MNPPSRRVLVVPTASSRPELSAGTRRVGDGCYRVEVKGEPRMQLDFTHSAENGDHNVSGMLTTAMRLVTCVDAVVAAEPGLVTALDLPLVSGRGLAG